MSGRSSWDQYFMDIARQVATRATCDRKHVGALLVRDRTILSTGYNGSIRGLPHCDDVGHMMENGHCVATVHAEANAIIQAAKNGVAHRRGDHLHHRQPLLAVLQADRQRRLRAHRLRRVLPGPAHLRVRRQAGASSSSGLGDAAQPPGRRADRRPTSVAATPGGAALTGTPVTRRPAGQLGGRPSSRLTREFPTPARITGPGLTLRRALPKSSLRQGGGVADGGNSRGVSVVSSTAATQCALGPGRVGSRRWTRPRYGAVPALMDSLLHDVRNPLNALAINLEVLAEKLKGETGRCRPRRRRTSGPCASRSSAWTASCGSSPSSSSPAAGRAGRGGPVRDW